MPYRFPPDQRSSRSALARSMFTRSAPVRRVFARRVFARIVFARARRTLGAGACNMRGLCPATLLWILVILMWSLSGCGGPLSSSVQASAPATVVVVATPRPIEVTRVVLSERIVEATPTPPHACAPQHLADAQEIVIGLLAPISEPPSLATALGVQAALSIGVDELNGKGGIGGKPVRLLIVDTAGGAEQAERQATEAITKGCASALIGSSSSVVAHSVLEVAHRYGVPYFIVDAADDDLTARGYPEIFRLAPTNSMLVQTPGDWLEAVGDYNNDGKRSALLITEESDASAMYAAWLTEEFARHGFTTDTYSVMLPSQDFSSLVARLVMRPIMPDVIFIRVGGDAALVLQSQLLANGIGPQKQSLIVANRMALESAGFWSAVGPAGAFTVVPRVGPWLTAASDEGLRFAGQYTRYMNRWPDAPSFAARDALFVLADAMKRAADLTSAQLVPALEQTDLELASGRVHFAYGSQLSPTAVGKPAWAWHQWLEPAQLFLQYTAPDQPAAQMAVIWPPQAATVGGAVARPAIP